MRLDKFKAFSWGAVTGCAHSMLSILAFHSKWEAVAIWALPVAMWGVGIALLTKETAETK